MGKYYTFHKTQRGYLHILKEIPCEDYSGSYAKEHGQFYLAVVADGHGDAASMRSGRGARFAVEAAAECLAAYACRPKETDIRGLAGRIVDCWTKRVEEDLLEPLSEEELKKAGRYEEAYRKGERLKHVYGTTLIAALMLPDSLILLQQGDGRCEVFYEDGTADQPVPWDEKCHENVTTSLCDEDAAEEIRFRVLDLTEKKVIACYLGSDGVEDSYRNIEGIHTFYRDLTCRLYEAGPEGIGAYLEEMLPGFSRQGSGDDVSVGGIVDLERLKEHIPAFQNQVKRYCLEEEAARYESRKISMSRKHGILKKRWEEAKQGGEQFEEYDRAYREIQAAIDRIHEELAEFR